MDRARAVRKRAAQNIRNAAKKRGMPLKHVADFAPVSVSGLQFFLAGSKDATIGWLVKVAGALDLEAWELLAPEEVREAWRKAKGG